MNNIPIIAAYIYDQIAKEAPTKSIMYYIMDELDKLHQSNDFIHSNELLEYFSNDPEFIINNVRLVLSLLTITGLAKGKIPYREIFYNKCKSLWDDKLGERKTYKLLRNHK